MQVLIDLTDDDMDKILVEGLKRGFEVNRNFAKEPNYHEVNQAFMTLLNYYMLEKDYNKYIKPFNKNNTAKKLAEAYGGL